MYINHQSLNKTLTDKLKNVLNLLDESKREFEVMEQSIQDEDVRKIIAQLIAASTLYADQLSSNIRNEKRSARIIAKEKTDGKANREKELRLKPVTTDDLLNECSRNEWVFEKAYRDVLNSCTMQAHLRDMMNDQLNEIKWKLMKIRIRYMINNNMVYPSLQTR